MIRLSGEELFKRCSPSFIFDHQPILCKISCALSGMTTNSELLVNFSRALRSAQPLKIRAYFPEPRKTRFYALLSVLYDSPCAWKRERFLLLRNQQMCDLAVICHSDIGFARGHPHQLFRLDDELAVFRNIDAAGTVGT